MTAFILTTNLLFIIAHSWKPSEFSVVADFFYKETPSNLRLMMVDILILMLQLVRCCLLFTFSQVLPDDVTFGLSDLNILGISHPVPAETQSQQNQQTQQQSQQNQDIQIESQFNQFNYADHLGEEDTLISEARNIIYPPLPSQSDHELLHTTPTLLLDIRLQLRLLLYSLKAMVRGTEASTIIMPGANSRRLPV
jgi:hypothetical protein